MLSMITFIIGLAIGVKGTHNKYEIGECKVVKKSEIEIIDDKLIKDKTYMSHICKGKIKWKN
jgi:hypothetical protein